MLSYTHPFPVETSDRQLARALLVRAGAANPVLEVDMIQDSRRRKKMSVELFPKVAEKPRFSRFKSQDSKEKTAEFGFCLFRRAGK